MHVVFVTTELATPNHSSGGLASFTANIARVFRENGNQVSIILVSTKEVEIDFDDGIDLYTIYVPMKIWKCIDKYAALAAPALKENKDILRRLIMLKYKSFKTRWIIRKIHKNNPIDIIHCSHHISVQGLLTRNIPYIVRISCLGNIWRGANAAEGNVGYNENPISIIDRFEENVIKDSRYVVSPSNLLAGIVQDNMGVNVNVIESPFVLRNQDWDYSVLEQHSLKDKKYVIHYGSLRYFKGTHVVAKLAKGLLQKNRDLYLVLAGNSGNIQDEHGNIIKAHEMVEQGAGEYADRVIYVGKLVREQLYPLIQNSELCLLPSRMENLANACIEAMSMGKIVVATDGASYEQLIDDGVNGFLCERDNPESFLQGIEKALSLNEEEKRRMECKAVETVKRLSPYKVYNQYLDFYEKVIKEW